MAKKRKAKKTKVKRAKTKKARKTKVKRRMSKKKSQPNVGTPEPTAIGTSEPTATDVPPIPTQIASASIAG